MKRYLYLNNPEGSPSSAAATLPLSWPTSSEHSAQITIIHRRDLMLWEEHTDVSRRFTEVYQRRFNIVLDAQVAGVFAKYGEIIVEVTTPSGKQSITSDTLLMATGRVPNTDLLDMAKTGVDLNDHGYIKTDEFLQTNVPSIWALGDIVGRYLLKHSANLEAAYASNNIMEPDNQAAVDYSAMPMRFSPCLRWRRWD